MSIVLDRPGTMVSIVLPEYSVFIRPFMTSCHRKQGRHVSIYSYPSVPLCGRHEACIQATRRYSLRRHRLMLP